MSLDPCAEFHRIVIAETTPDKPDKIEIVIKAFSTGRVASLCGANGLVLIVLLPLTTADSQYKTISGWELYSSHDSWGD